MREKAAECRQPRGIRAAAAGGTTLRPLAASRAALPEGRSKIPHCGAVMRCDPIHHYANNCRRTLNARSINYVEKMDKGHAFYGNGGALAGGGDIHLVQ